MYRPTAVVPPPAFARAEGFLRRLEAMTSDERLTAYSSGNFSRAERSLWARAFPDEVPVVNGEVEWIALGLADLD